MYCKRSATNRFVGWLALTGALFEEGGGGGGGRDSVKSGYMVISQFVNSLRTHDPKISTDLLHYGYVPLVHFRIITVKVMEVLHEYLLFALLRRILLPVYQINVLSVHK